MKRFLSILLISIFVINLMPFVDNAYAISTYKKVTKYHLDLGCVHVWTDGSGYTDKYTATYQNGIAYDSKQSFSATLTFSDDIQEVTDAYVLDPDEFQWDDRSLYSFNGTTYLTGSSDFKNNYADYVCNSISSINPTLIDSNTVNLSYTAKLKSPKDFDLAAGLNSGQFDSIIDRLGGKSAVKSDLYSLLENGADNGVGDGIFAYIFFVPIVIEYQVIEKVEVAVGDFEPGLDVPTSAHTGESFTVKDTTVFGTPNEFAESQLYYSVDGGAKKEVADWDGTTLNTDINQSFDEECSVTYYLTVWNTYGDSKSTDEKIVISDDKEIDCIADLVLSSKYTYEGHPVDAEDESTFVVDGTNYSAKRAYTEGIAKNSYKVTSGTYKKDGYDAICTWPTKGTYPVTLNIKTENGDSASDTEYMEVRKTPSIEANLGGYQKQNRKQILTFNVAIYPDKPIVDYSIRIKDLVTNEIINLTKDSPQENGAIIKSRVATMDESGQYWTTITVEFLTKMPRYSDTGLATRAFSYDAKVTDSKGDSDEVYKEFNVAPDVPPNPLISMQNSFLRAEGTNTATIEAIDASTTDGDQLDRSWLVANHNPSTGLATGQKTLTATIPSSSFVNATLISGYENLAFGTNQTIGFNKEGVGKSTVKLHVKDVWNEPTLEEYINASDYLEAETTASTEVINIAPVVSLEPLDTLKANIAILVSVNNAETVKNQVNSLNASLIEKGIDGNISVVPVADNYDGNMTCLSTVSNEGVLRASLASSKYIYSIISTGITANTSNGNLIWSYPLTDTGSNSLYIDNEEKYLICPTNNNYTLIINADTGALLKKIDGVILTGNIFLSADGKRIYTVTDTGINKYDMKTGKYTTVKIISCSLPRIFEGKIGFVGKMTDTKYYLGFFDMSTELIESKVLPELKYTGSSSNMNSGGMVSVSNWSTDGKVLLTRNPEVWVLDSDTQKQTHIIQNGDKRWTAFLIKDDSGASKYTGIGITSEGTSTYRYCAYLYKNDGSENSQCIANASSGKMSSIKYPSVGYHDTKNQRIYFIDPEFYGLYSCYDLKTNTWIETSGSISNIGLSYYTGTLTKFDGRLVSSYYDSEAYNYTGFSKITQYILPITQDQSAYNSLIKKSDFDTDSNNYILSYGLGDNLSKVIEFAEQQGASFLSFTGSETATVIADKLDEIKDQAKYTLNMVGNGANNLASIIKNLNLEPNTTYQYSYDMNVVSGSAVDVFRPNTNNTGSLITNSGTVYYKEPVYKGDLTNGDNTYINNGFVSFNSGYWFNDNDYGQDGYGGGSYTRKHDSGGPSVSFTLAKDGYIELTMANDFSDGYGYNRTILVDGTDVASQSESMSTWNYNGVSTFLMFVKAGTHTLSSNANNDYETHNVMKYLEIGYLNTENNSFTPTSVSTTVNGTTQTVNGTFTSQKDIGYVKTNTTTNLSTLNIYNLMNSGNMTLGTSWTKGYYSVSSDGKTLTGTYTGRIPNNNKITVKCNVSIKAPADKILWFTYNGTTRILKPSESYSLGYNQSFYYGSGNGYSTSVSIMDGFYAVEIPVGTCGITADSLLTKGTSVQLLEGISLNKQEATPFYMVDVTSISGTTIISKCNTSPIVDNDNIAFGTWNSGNTTLNTLISNFTLKAIYSKYNIKGLQVEDGFVSLDELTLNSWNKYLTGSGSAEIKLAPQAAEEEETSLVYKKGQLVSYNITYSDYESDPSKKEYWIYAHTPYNDGEQEEAAIIYDEDGNIIKVGGTAVSGITMEQAVEMAKAQGLYLSDSIDRFYVDGKYTVWHWQEDDTSRGTATGGYTNYDKASNIESLTFYIQGGASAPWITGISTSPAKVTENNYFSINIGIDDAEKDVLNLTTEVYKDKKLFFTHRKKNIAVNEATGEYPNTNTGALPSVAQAGTYEVVATVRDDTGAGLGTYKFIVVSEGKITGYVNHTDKWEENRKKYNLSLFDNEVNTVYSYSDYLALSEPRKRGTNVFWSGEKFILRAAVSGSPTKVTCNINGTSYSTTMSSTGTKNSDDETIYTGTIWDEDMINKWGMKEPEPLIFTFTATYSGGTTKTHKATVIVDNMNPYWRLHRAF